MVSWQFLFQLTIAASYGQAKSNSSGNYMSGNCISVQASLDFMNQTYSGSGSSTTDESRTGFNLGVFITHPFSTTMSSGELAFKAGLEFIEKGTHLNSVGDYHVAANYLEIPINVLYEFKLGGCNAVFAGLGPYFAYGVGGKTTFTNAGQTTSTNLFSDSSVKRFDFGLNITAGYRIGCGWSFAAAYEPGLIDIFSHPTGGQSGKNHGWSVNLAYCLGQHSKK